MTKKIAKTVSGAIVGFALCFSSTVASAAVAPAPAAPMSISPFVALSAYGTMQSRSAVCAAAVGAAAASAAAQGQVPVQGCVLPVLDPAAAPAAAVPIETPPIAYAPVATRGFGFGIGALLAGLVLVAGLAAVLLSNNDGRLPISPD